jgi:Fe-S-cluster-containing hydrogenase component 2
MNFNVIDRRVFKCDLCDGEPQCVRFCDVKAVEYVDADAVAIDKKRVAAERLSLAGKEASALMAQL